MENAVDVPETVSNVEKRSATSVRKDISSKMMKNVKSAGLGALSVKTRNNVLFVSMGSI